MKYTLEIRFTLFLSYKRNHFDNNARPEQGDYSSTSVWTSLITTNRSPNENETIFLYDATLSYLREMKVSEVVNEVQKNASRSIVIAEAFKGAFVYDRKFMRSQEASRVMENLCAQRDDHMKSLGFIRGGGCSNEEDGFVK